jgi:hypothetical protein
MGTDPTVCGRALLVSIEYCCSGNMRSATGPKTLVKTGLRVGMQAQMTAALSSVVDQFAMATKYHVLSAA